MKTLPDAIIADKGGDSGRVILVRIIPESGDTWGELLWATKDITVTDWEGGGTLKSFGGGVLKQGQLGKISQSVDIVEGGNIAKVSSLTFKINNPEYNGMDRFDQSFAGNLENRTVEFYLAFWTGSNLAWSDIHLLHRFVVDDIHYEYGEYTIKVKDAGFKRHKNIPDLILEKTDYPNLPDYNEGKVPALVFGNLGSVETHLSNVSVSPIIKADKSKPKYIVSRNKSNFVSNIQAIIYLSEVNRWGLIYQVSAFTRTYGRPTMLEFHLNESILATLNSQGEGQGEKTTPTTLNFSEAIDDSISTYFTLAENQKLYLRIPIPSEFARIQGEATNLKLEIYTGAITGTGIIKYYNPEWDDGVGGFSDGQAFDSGDADGLISYPFGNDKTAHGKHPLQEDQDDPWTFDEIATYEFGLECNAASSIQIKNIHVWMGLMLYKGLIIHKTGKAPRRRGPGKRDWRKEQINFLQSGDNMFADVDGASFGSWIDQDSRNNGYDEDDLVEYGAYIIESILRDELDLTSPKIDYEAFDEVGNTTNGDRKDWKFASVISEQGNSLEIIQGFCRECAIIYYANYENKETIKALKKQTAVKTIDRTTIGQNEIKPISFSDLKNVYNKFYLSYKKQWTNDSFTKTLFVTASDHNLSSNTRSGTPNTYTGLCSDSQDKYLKTNRLTLDCDWIRDDATAELLIKWLAEWLCYRKYIVEFETAGLDHIGLELGDQVLIDHTLLPTGVSNDDSFLLYDISYDLDNDKMRFKFMQVPDLLT